MEITIKTDPKEIAEIVAKIREQPVQKYSVGIKGDTADINRITEKIARAISDDFIKWLRPESNRS